MGAARGSEECLLSEWGQGVTVPFLSVQAELEQPTLSSRVVRIHHAPGSPPSPSLGLPLPLNNYVLQSRI